MDATGAVLGTGLTHIMSAAHLEARDTTFQHMHAGLIKYLSKEEEEEEKSKDVMTATFHFLNLGRTLMTGMEPVGEIGVSVGKAGLGCTLSTGLANVGHTGFYVVVCVDCLQLSGQHFFVKRMFFILSLEKKLMRNL